jgi:hypothetical protein
MQCVINQNFECRLVLFLSGLYSNGRHLNTEKAQYCAFERLLTQCILTLFRCHDALSVDIKEGMIIAINYAACVLLLG